MKSEIIYKIWNILFFIFGSIFIIKGFILNNWQFSFIGLLMIIAIIFKFNLIKDIENKNGN